MVSLDAELRQELDALAGVGRYRRRALLATPQAVQVLDGDTPLRNFCSNDYLGLASHPRLREAAIKAIHDYGVGSGASHLVCGHSELHQALEEQLAAVTGRERALLFSTGYMANTGTLTALLGRGDHLLQDRLNHASLLDGGRLSGARMQRFHHNDLADLSRRLEALPDSGRRLVAVDAVFSMDGDCAPLAELSALAAQHGAVLMADDAHGFGVRGHGGAGSAAAAGLDINALPVLMGTLGKALGSFGAFIAGSETLIETLIQKARPYIYTTALPPAVAAASLAGLELLQQEAWRRDRLNQRISSFRELAERRELPLMPSDSPIQPLLAGSDTRAMAWSSGLRQRGFWVSAIRPPTVPEGSARLRVTLSAAHSQQDVEDLVDALAEVCGAG